MVKNRRKKAYKKGLRAEVLAALYLRLKGYRIIARRFKTHAGEIDLIARRGNLVAIVEVKARDTEQQAHEAITLAAQRRIEAAADIWLARQSDYARLSLRFDVIIIRPWHWPRHLPAFFCARVF